MNGEKIEKLDDLLRTKLGPHKKIIDHSVTRLTAPGENYGSLMLSVDIKVFDEKENKEEHINVVAKMLPPTQILRDSFNVQVTFKKELGFYAVIVPLLEHFQKEQGVTEIVNFYPKFFGGRINLDSASEKVDDDALILLENLKTSGFKTMNRMKGFDLEAATIILRSMADLHAIPLALKLKKPKLFDSDIKPYMSDFDLGVIDKEYFLNILHEDENCVPYLDKAMKLINQRSTEEPREPFGTIMHNDCWVNNILIKYENNQVVATKIIDYQIMEYKSPCRDLLFFLFSSVQMKVLETHLSKLIDIYYIYFIQKLNELKCDVSLFSKEKFLNEVKLAAIESEYFHVILMLVGIFQEAKEAVDLTEVTKEFFFKPKAASRELKERAWFCTREFGKRGWLG